MMINLDVAATAYFQSGPLTELVVKMLDRRTVGNDSIIIFFVSSLSQIPPYCIDKDSMVLIYIYLFLSAYVCVHIRRPPPRLL